MGGGLAQQDASECWTEIVRALQARLPAAPGASALRYYPHTVWAAAWRSRTPPSAGQRSCARCRPACPPRPAPPRSGTTSTLYGRRPGAAGRLRVLDRDRARAAGPPARRARRLRAQVLPPHCMGGGLAQQDASECWTEIVRALQARLPAAPGASALRYYPHTVWAAAWRSRTPPSAGQRSCARCRPACPPRPAPPRSGTTSTLYGRRPGAAGRLRVLDRDRARAAGPPARRARRLRAQVLPPHCMGGGLAQQDASECWTEIVRALQARLPAAPGASALRYYLHTVWAAAWRSRTPPSAGQRSCARCRPACPPRPAPPRSGTTPTLYGRRPGAAGRLRVLDRDRARAAGPPARRARRLRAQVLPPHCMGGGLAQQDASECWTEIVRALQARLPAAPGASALRSSVIEQYFGGTLDVELVCSEADEPPTRTTESFLQLSCFISQDVKYLQSGLRSKMAEQITKMSQTLGRDAIYTKTSKISRLPAYLTVQFVRFYYKEKESINAKILKDVKFPLELDVLELCSPELQERLAPMRSKFKELEDAKVEASLNARNKNHGDSSKEIKKKTALPYWFENDVGSNNSGYYRLQAVLTHRGRSSSSGHYVAWVARGDSWLRCDDDAVSPVTEEEVLKLSGGGDWHCAYLLLYGPKILELPEEDDEPMVTDVSDDTAGVPPTALA
ncbi:uncharacterized protein LOC113503276 isoform X1 [Trichoplusia ni]|uniref:ubiquitinyl hydrolase 1 n=1 Tax=Trichoplusia ni TaxID=7111 RepID=A0A7E5WJG2_TRINI|nr:uncharacterized protein LOC113503276 isoform X1 [Trichoplusia ni]